MEKIRNKLGFRQSIVVASAGASGGLCLLWTEEVNIRALSFSPHHIDVEVQVLGVHGKWRLTGFYGHPVTAERHKSWELLSRLGSASSLPWVCIGDFNEILAAHEKLGGAVRNERQMQNFRQAIDSCGLKDLGYRGPKFTWWRNGPEDIRVRLDRGLATWEWCTLFPQAKIQKTRAQLGALLNCPCSTQTVEERKRLTAHLDSLLIKDELFWRQRSRAIWLKAGDNNSNAAWRILW
ncbi:unnamed protein product [Prunus brigantina]